MYANGKGVPKNIPEAIRWLKEAAEQEYPGAQETLAKMYQATQLVLHTLEGLNKD